MFRRFVAGLIYNEQCAPAYTPKRPLNSINVPELQILRVLMAGRLGITGDFAVDFTCVVPHLFLLAPRVSRA
jgi:hypothetical protein